MLLLIPALLPIITALILMCKFKVSPGKSMLTALLLAVFAAAAVWKLDMLRIVYAAIWGVFKSLDIILIIAGAVFLLNILKKSGALQSIKRTFSNISNDRRIQIIVIAWLFSGFVEGASGFGAAPALAAPLLAGLGFPALTAVATALICNTLPVPFGAVGIPAMTSVSTISSQLEKAGIPQAEFSYQVLDKLTMISGLSGAVLPLLAITFMIMVNGKERKVRSIVEIIPLALLSAAAYIIPWRIAALTLGAELPSMIGAIVGLPVVLLCIKMKFLVPEYVWDFPGEKEMIQSGTAEKVPKIGTFQALLPYLAMAVSLLILRMPGWEFQEILGKVQITLPPLPSLPGSGSSWKILNNPGLIPITLIALISAWGWKFTLKETVNSAKETLKQISVSAIAIAASTAVVQIMITSGNNPAAMPGMLDCVAQSCAAVMGKAYLVISPFIGIFGTFFAGSCTVSNILFAPLQFDTAQMLNISPELTVALQNIGGGLGSMIRISGVIAACATVNAAGKEGKIIMMNLFPAVIMALLTVILAYTIG